jgi:hypothetical protein
MNWILGLASLAVPGDEEWEKALERAAGLKKYRCVSSLSDEHKGRSLRGPGSLDVTTDDDAPALVKIGGIELYRKGDRSFAKDRDGNWTAQEKDFAGLRPIDLLSLRGWKPFPERVAEIRKHLEKPDVRKTDDGVEYSFRLRGAGIPLDFQMLVTPIGGEKVASPDFSGSVAILIDKAGNPRKVTATYEARDPNPPCEILARRILTWEVSEVGTAKVAVPEAVTKLMGK